MTTVTQPEYLQVMTTVTQPEYLQVMTTVSQPEYLQVMTPVCQPESRVELNSEKVHAVLEKIEKNMQSLMLILAYVKNINLQIQDLQKWKEDNKLSLSSTSLSEAIKIVIDEKIVKPGYSKFILPSSVIRYICVEPFVNGGGTEMTNDAKIIRIKLCLVAIKNGCNTTNDSIETCDEKIKKMEDQLEKLEIEKV